MSGFPSPDEQRASDGRQSSRPDIQELLSRRSLVRNTVLNVVGHGVPLIVGLVAIPVIVKGLGTDRIGLLTLAWALIGYFSLFDLGLGRATTQLVAEKLGERDTRDASRAVWTALSLMCILGVIGAVIAVAISPWLAYSAFEIPAPLREEALWAFISLAASIPILITSSGLSGVLAGLQRFDILNAIRIPMGMSTFLVPAAVVPFTHSLFHVCVALVAVRAFFLALYVFACFKALPSLRLHFGISPGQIN